MQLLHYPPSWGISLVVKPWLVTPLSGVQFSHIPPFNLYLVKRHHSKELNSSLAGRLLLYSRDNKGDLAVVLDLYPPSGRQNEMCKVRCIKRRKTLNPTAKVVKGDRCFVTH